MNPHIKTEIAHILRTLRPYRNEFVVTGGVCAALYHLEKGGDIGRPLFTTDLDLAFPDRKLDSTGESLSELLEGADYKKSVSRHGITKYKRELEEGKFEVEFLLPAIGEDPKEVGRIQDDLRGEKLRYVRLLLKAEMQTVEIGGRSVEYRRPRPGVYILHRALIVDRRSDTKDQKKDYAYMLDLIELFSDEFSLLKDQIQRTADKSEEFDAWIDKGREKIRKCFLKENDPLQYALDRVDDVDENRAKALIEEFLREIDT